MAQDRLFLQCKRCGDSKDLVTLYVAGPEVREVREWVEDHVYDCYGDTEERLSAWASDSFAGETFFVLRTESGGRG